MVLNPRSVLLIAGTRPEIIKLAPLMMLARDQCGRRLRVQLCVTGQHQKLADEALAMFLLKADHNLGIMKADQTPNDITAAVFEKMPSVLHHVQPDVVVVQGDTTSAAAAALCASNRGIPVAHVEAGLRSHDLTAPFPEEINRKVITATAQFNFCPTELARRNLLRESIPAESIVVTGNTVVDALRIIEETHATRDLTVVDRSIRKPFVLVTAHRRESFGEGIKNICSAIKQCAQRFPDHQFIYPVHLNPNIDNPVRRLLAGVHNILLLPPISYLNLLTLLKNCELVVSDSGGIQEEAPSFSKYCVVLRNVTERQESVDLGLSELVGTDPGRIVGAVTKKLGIRSPYPSLPNPYGDGHAAERILETLASHQVLS
jgi:UDP-N-acetylglucosamine 2-epimerase